MEGLLSLPTDLFYNIFDFLQDEDLVKTKKICKKISNITKMKIRTMTKNIIKDDIFKKDFKKLTWLNEHNFYLLKTVRKCIVKKHLTNTFHLLSFIYLENFISKRIQIFDKMVFNDFILKK